MHLTNEEFEWLLKLVRAQAKTVHNNAVAAHQMAQKYGLPCDEELTRAIQTRAAFLEQIEYKISRAAGEKVSS